MMKLPNYIPAEVRSRISCQLYGNGDYIGDLAMLASIEKDIEDKEVVKTAYENRGEVEYVEDLRIQIFDLGQSRDRLANDIECWKRLILRFEMEEAFQQLVMLDYSDDRIFRILCAAVAANMPFQGVRDKFLQAKDEAKKISKTAKALQGQLNAFDRFSIPNTPLCFSSVKDLLYVTPNDQDCMWKIERQKLLEDGANAYSFSVAPTVPMLMGSLVCFAKEFDPADIGVVGAAVNTRQQNPKTEYLRAFTEGLSHHGVDLDKEMVSPAVIIANVALDSADIDISCGDLARVFAMHESVAQ